MIFFFCVEEFTRLGFLLSLGFFVKRCFYLVSTCFNGTEFHLSHRESFLV